jgi:hypothetical protein
MNKHEFFLLKFTAESLTNPEIDEQKEEKAFKEMWNVFFGSYTSVTADDAFSDYKAKNLQSKNTEKIKNLAQRHRSFSKSTPIERLQNLFKICKKQASFTNFKGPTFVKSESVIPPFKKIDEAYKNNWGDLIKNLPKNEPNKGILDKIDVLRTTFDSQLRVASESPMAVLTKFIEQKTRLHLFYKASVSIGFMNDMSNCPSSLILNNYSVFILQSLFFFPFKNKDHNYATSIDRFASILLENPTSFADEYFIKEILIHLQESYNTILIDIKNKYKDKSNTNNDSSQNKIHEGDFKFLQSLLEYSPYKSDFSNVNSFVIAKYIIDKLAENPKDIYSMYSWVEYFTEGNSSTSKLNNISLFDVIDAIEAIIRKKADETNLMAVLSSLKPAYHVEKFSFQSPDNNMPTLRILPSLNTNASIVILTAKLLNLDISDIFDAKEFYNDVKTHNALGLDEIELFKYFIGEFTKHKDDFIKSCDINELTALHKLILTINNSKIVGINDYVHDMINESDKDKLTRDFHIGLLNRLTADVNMKEAKLYANLNREYSDELNIGNNMLNKHMENLNHRQENIL